MPARVHERLHRLEEIGLGTLRQMDRERTVALLPVGMVEIHGDHLPLGTDTYAVEALTLAAAAWLLEGDPALHVLLLPTIPYGTDPVDLRRPDLFGDAGSVWVSRETLKSLVADVAGHLARFGFRYVFPVGFHGGPDQCRVLSQVCAEMRASHPGLVMFEPMGYVMAGAELEVTPGLSTLLGRPLTAKELVMLQGSIHGSMFETSMMLHLQPELVDPSYRSLRTIEWSQLYKMADWPGYVGAAPAHADPEIGAAVVRWRGVRAAALIRRAMDGEDLSRLPRHPVMDDEQPADGAGADLQRAAEAQAEQAQAEQAPAEQAPTEQAPASGPAEQAESGADRPAHKQPTPPSGVIRTQALGKLEKPPKPGEGQQAKGTTEGTESTEG